MTRNFLLAGAVAVALTSAAAAQSPRLDPTATATAATGTMTSEQVGVQALTGVSSTDYVAQAAASDMFERESGRIAEDKAKNPDVKSFAAMMVSDHKSTTDALKGALKNSQRKLAPPSDQLPEDKQAMVDQLKHTKAGPAFDTLYLNQQKQAHQQAWALHKGYAVDGDDAALRQVAAGAVPVVERHLTMLAALQPAS